MNQNYHILFVDDEIEILNSIRRILHTQQTQWKMDFVTSVDQAIKFIENDLYDVVVTDMKFPIKDGFHLIHFLTSQEKTKDTQIIVLTGLDENRLKQRVLDLGVIDLLNKPINPQELKSRLRSALRIKNYQDELRYQNRILENEVRRQTFEIQKNQYETIMRLAMISEYHETQTGKHILRVAAFSSALAQYLGFSEKKVEEIYFASPLHDIGKIRIPREILLKQEKLTPNEWEVIKKHSYYGYEILSENEHYINQFLNELPLIHQFNKNIKSKNPILNLAAKIALSHHENWDGSGYPNQNKHEEIPIEARIVAIADSYDALRSQRPYKPPFNEIDTIQLLLKDSGIKFDPNLLEIFIKNRLIFNQIFNKLNHGINYG